MMNKKTQRLVWIGGGAAAVGVLGLILYEANKSSSTSGSTLNQNPSPLNPATCPPGQEKWPPIVGSCVPVCPPGQVRNFVTGQCENPINFGGGPPPPPPPPGWGIAQSVVITNLSLGGTVNVDYSGGQHALPINLVSTPGSNWFLVNDNSILDLGVNVAPGQLVAVPLGFQAVIVGVGTTTLNFRQVSSLGPGQFAATVKLVVS